MVLALELTQWLEQMVAGTWKLEAHFSSSSDRSCQVLTQVPFDILYDKNVFHVQLVKADCDLTPIRLKSDRA